MTENNGNSERRQRWDARYAQKELVWSAGPNQRFAQEVQGLAPGRALDVACGEGRNALWLAEQGWQATGIDFSRVAIDKARQIAARRGVEVEWLAGDVATYAFTPGSFDLVAVLYLHTDPRERTRWLVNVVQALKPGGTFLYIGHDPRNIIEGVGGPQDPQFLPSADELVAALEDSAQQIEIITATVIERSVDSDPGHGAAGPGVALDTLVRVIKC